MKPLGTIFVALLIAEATKATAQDLQKELGVSRFKSAVEDCLVALKSPNDGLRRSAIYLLGQLEANEAVILLMRVLRGNKDEKSRIAAAWALCKIGDEAGTNAVKQVVRFDESKKVQMHAALYYNLYVSEGTFVFVPVADGSITIAEGR